MSRKNQTLILAERIARKLVAEQTQARIMLGFDAALIAAHEALGMGPGRAAAFSQAYHEAMEELAGLYVDDAEQNGDKHIDYAKGKRDELIRKIVGEDNFVEFDRAYGEAYMDELKRIRLRQELSTSSGAAAPPSPRGEGKEKTDCHTVERDGSQ